jgi:polar amino acid transport system ATP-binding protein
MLKIKEVIKKTTRNIMALNTVSFAVNKQEIVGLAGPSGSGKSTLLRCIQGIETVTSGVIEKEGSSGFMFQDFQLFPHMTVLQNLVYAPSLQDPQTNHEVAARVLLDRLGIAETASSRPHALSGGQKQRVALARSLMMHPGILLCDEPTSGLDVATITDIIKLLSSVRDLGITMIIASHDLDFLTKIADRIILLKAGNIIEDVKPSELKNPIEYLTNLY